MKLPSSLLTTFALALALRPEVLAQDKLEQKPKSPQNKIVREYDLEKILDKAIRDYESGSGCRQPNATKEEKELFNDFRKMAERAKVPDALLLVCKTIQDQPQWSMGFSGQSEPNVVRAQNPLKLERKQRNAILGHEITHVANKDRYHLVDRDLAIFKRDLAILRAVAEFRAQSGDPLSTVEVTRINRAIMTEANRVDQLIYTKGLV
jgi:hypothetical protein